MTPKHSVVVTVWSGVVPESGRASIFILICNSNSNSARVSKDRKRRKRKVESTKCSDWSIEAITLRVLQLSMIRNAEWIYKKKIERNGNLGFGRWRWEWEEAVIGWPCWLLYCCVAKDQKTHENGLLFALLLLQPSATLHANSPIKNHQHNNHLSFHSPFWKGLFFFLFWLIWSSICSSNIKLHNLTLLLTL